MQKIKIVGINTKMIDTKKGPAKQIGIFDGEKWYSTWGNKETERWNKGDTVEGTVTPREYNNKIYYNYNKLIL